MTEVPEVFMRYDIRGYYPEELNEDFAERLGRSAGTYGKRLVVVGYDTRKSSIPLKEALIKGILSTGVNVIDLGISTSDKVALAGNYYKADFSIIITASHNPWEMNGFKFFYQRGNGFSNGDMKKIKEIFLDGKFKMSESSGELSDKFGEFSRIYEERVLLALKEYMGELRSLNGKKIVVDCANGGASLHLPKLLKKLGASVIEVNCSTKPDYSLEPEPEEKNRMYLYEIMKKENADLVVGTDPDADRIFAFDKNGWISGDELFAIFAHIIKPSKISASLDTSHMLNEVSGADVVYTRVGDIFVSRKAIEIGAEFCGEPNGHYAFPKFCWYNSGTFGSLILAYLQNPSEIRSKFPTYFVKKHKIKLESQEEKINKMNLIGEKIKQKYEIISDLDGVKFKIGNTNALIRPSGTSNVIRAVVESKNEDESQKALEEIMRVVE
ncbi:MAG: hypothetical protein J7K87_01200 [Candidatus Aenigmarchaeota archaeon]|nr:hypothetical protein [Candidatus Aenigmarchaeota archaeon]